MLDRQTALAFIMHNEKTAKRKFLETAEEIFKLNPHLPIEVRSQFLQTGDLKVNEDWMARLEHDIWAGVIDCGLEQLKQEMA